jgi:hypothetical protein
VITSVPLYGCARCGSRCWWRMPPGAWQCSACTPWWRDAGIVAVGALPAGIRPALAFADAPAVAQENAAVCASRQRFLAAVAEARATLGVRA